MALESESFFFLTTTFCAGKINQLTSIAQGMRECLSQQLVQGGFYFLNSFFIGQLIPLINKCFSV